jgi:hypothetical protein
VSKNSHYRNATLSLRYCKNDVMALRPRVEVPEHHDRRVNGYGAVAGLGPEPDGRSGTTRGRRSRMMATGGLSNIPSLFK